MWIRANGPGIGDAVFLSSVAHEVKKQTGEFVGIACEYRELYRHNPDVDQTVGLHEAENPLTFPELHDQGNIKEHNVQFMCRKAGLVPPAWEDIRQYVYLTDDEIVDDSSYITVHTGTGNWTPNKSWHGFRDLIQLLRRDYRVYQIVGPGEEELPCDEHLRLPLRYVAAYIKGALLHVCCVTGTMHIASGVGTKSVVIYGGRERARVTGYYNNINIETSPPQGCAACWLVEPCPHGVHRDGQFHKPCLDMITPEQVWRQARISLGSEPSASLACGRYPLLL